MNKRTNRIRKGAKIGVARAFAEANPLDRLLALGTFPNRAAACREFTNPGSRHFKHELRKVKAQQLIKAYKNIVNKRNLDAARAAVEAGEDDQHHRHRIAKKKELQDSNKRRNQEAVTARAAIEAGEPVTDADKENVDRYRASLDRRNQMRNDRRKRVKMNHPSATAHDIAVVNKQTAEKKALNLKKMAEQRGKRREINDTNLRLIRRQRGAPRWEEILAVTAHDDGHNTVADGGAIVHGSPVAPHELLGSSGNESRFRGQTCAPGSFLWTSFPEGNWSGQGAERPVGQYVWAIVGGIVPSKEADLTHKLCQMQNEGHCDKVSAATAALVHLQTKHKLDVTNSSNPPFYLYCFLREEGSPYRDFHQHKVNGRLVGGNAKFFMKHTGPAPVGPDTPGLYVMKVECGPQPTLSQVTAIDATKSTWIDNVAGVHDGCDDVVDLTMDEDEDEDVDVDL